MSVTAAFVLGFFIMLAMPSSIGSELRDIAKAINNLAAAVRESGKREGGSK